MLQPLIPGAQPETWFAQSPASGPTPQQLSPTDSPANVTASIFQSIDLIDAGYLSCAWFNSETDGGSLSIEAVPDGAALFTSVTAPSQSDADGYSPPVQDFGSLDLGKTSDFRCGEGEEGSFSCWADILTGAGAYVSATYAKGEYPSSADPSSEPTPPISKSDIIPIAAAFLGALDHSAPLRAVDPPASAWGADPGADLGAIQSMFGVTGDSDDMCSRGALLQDIFDAMYAEVVQRSNGVFCDLPDGVMIQVAPGAEWAWPIPYQNSDDQGHPTGPATTTPVSITGAADARHVCADDGGQMCWVEAVIGHAFVTATADGLDSPATATSEERDLTAIAARFGE